MTTIRKRERIHALAVAVERAAEADRRLRQGAAEGLGLGTSDFDALVLLYTSGPLAAGRIAEALAITTGAVTGLIDRLERGGWVQRTRHDADRRQVLIELAPARRDELDAHRQDRDRFVTEAIGDLDEAELGETTRVLDAIAERMLAGLARAAAARGDDSADGDRAPLGGSERGHLRFASGGAHVELRAARIKDLYRATFQGKRPQIAVEPEGLVTVTYKTISWLGLGNVSAQIALTTAVPWTIEIKRGVSHLTADLRDLEVTAIDITGGASECDLMLPRPRGVAALRITGGASRLVVKRPRGTAVQIVIRGGASSVVFDDQRSATVGSATRLATPGFDSAADRWTIELTGGASDVTVLEQA